MIYRTAIIFTLLLFIAAGVVVADTLTLKDGKVYHGKIIKQTKNEVEFEIYRLGGKLKFVKTFKMEDVHSITEGEIKVEVKKPKPTSNPTTRPESEPTTKPKDKPDKVAPPVAKKKRPKPAGPLDTPETLAEELQNIPKHPSEDKNTWENLTSLQKEDAEKKYRQQLEEHKKKNDFRGKAVSWMLEVCDVAKAKDGKGFILTSRSPKGSVVNATVSAAAKDDLLKLKKCDSVRVQGIIADYNFVKPLTQPGELFPDHKSLEFRVTIKDAGVILASDIPLVVLFEHHFEAKKIIFLVDSSGSTIDKIELIRQEIKQSVSMLNPGQEFAVVFFKNATNPANIVLKKATDQNKASAEEQARQVRAAGQSYVLPYLVQALKILAPGKESCAICLVTDGIVETDEAKRIFDAIKKHNPDNRVAINTFLVGDGDEESTEFLQAISELTGGEFSQIEAE